MRSITRYIEEKLGLKVNASKSKIDKPKGIKYLGFGFYYDSFAKEYRAKPHTKAVERFKARMKELTCRSWGVNNAHKVKKLNELIRGWINYFKIGSMKGLCEKLDANIRYRLRMCIWKHWKTPQNRAKNLIKLGISYKRKTNPIRISFHARLLRRRTKLNVKLIEPPCTERYARWCERSEISRYEKFPPTRYS